MDAVLHFRIVLGSREIVLAHVLKWHETEPLYTGGKAGVDGSLPVLSIAVFHLRPLYAMNQLAFNFSCTEILAVLSDGDGYDAARQYIHTRVSRAIIPVNNEV